MFHSMVSIVHQLNTAKVVSSLVLLLSLFLSVVVSCLGKFLKYIYIYSTYIKLWCFMYTDKFLYPNIRVRTALVISLC